MDTAGGSWPIAMLVVTDGELKRGPGQRTFGGPGSRTAPVRVAMAGGPGCSKPAESSRLLLGVSRINASVEDVAFRCFLILRQHDRQSLFLAAVLSREETDRSVILRIVRVADAA